MIFQQPAHGIAEMHDSPKTKSYKIYCQCGNPDHELLVSIEADGYGITVEHAVKVETDWWTKNSKWSIINGLWVRLKQTWNIWAHGHLYYHAYTIMDQQQALNYSETIKQAIDDVTASQKTSGN